MKKVALVTGASRGVGAGIARVLASAGYDLVLTCKNSETLLKESSEELSKDFGIRTRLFIGDVGDKSFVENMADSLKAEDFMPNVLINNAGIAFIGLLADTTYEKWDELISTNVSSVFYLSKLFSKDMINNKCGDIINISSMWGNVGASCEVAYSATKGAVNAFTKALAKELAPSNVRVNALSLGVIDTEMNNHLNEDEKRDLASEIPMDRFGTPVEVGKAVLSIIEGSPYMTGQIIGIDGGYI